MSKIVCQCNNIIIDQTDDLAYKAFFVRDQNFEKIQQRNSIIAQFIEAHKSGNKDKWLEKYFESDTYNNLEIESVINDILLRFDLEYQSTMYQCEKCGRLFVQKGNENNFLRFIPEEKDWKNIFKGL